MSLIEKVRIEALGNEAQGIGELSSGKKVFVPGVLPGELCEVEIVSDNSGFSEGVCISLLEASPARILSYGNFVPGADLAHLSYEAGLQYKEDKVRNCILRIGRLPSEETDRAMRAIIPCENPINYRNHMQYRLVGGRLCLINNITKMAEEPGNPILEYLIFTVLSDTLEEIFANAPTVLFEGVVMRGSERTREVMVELVSGSPEPHEVIIGKAVKYAEATSLVHLLTAACVEKGYRLTGITLRISATSGDKRTRSGLRSVICGQDYYEEILLGHKFRIHAGAFFQVNIPQAELLYRCAAEFTADAASLLDLYCGTGSIGLSILRPGQKLAGIETVAEAVKAAKENSALNGISSASFSIKAAENTDIASLDLPSPMAVIVDPPRKGLAPLMIRKLLEEQPYKICYISCDPATMSRDLSQLLSSGIYSLTSVQPVDMFPWTHHVETVCLLSQRKPDTTIEVDLDISELEVSSAETKATYEEIKSYVLKKFGLKVSNLYIAQVKRECGIVERINYNLPKTEGNRVPQCPEDKRKAIKDAFIHFQMI